MSLAIETPGVTVRVPGKINLSLLVGAGRADGFHEVATVLQAVAIYDHVTVLPATEWSVTVTGPWADQVPVDKTNLALKAAKALARAADVEDPVAIHIDKRIPVAGGMAGGSADAAATLVACEALWELGLTREDLVGHAAKLGSDVPFLLHGGTAIGTGRGEQVAPVLARGELNWVLWISPGPGLSAAEVYAECDRLRAEGSRGADQDSDEDDDLAEVAIEPQVPEELLSALRRMDADQVGPLLHNDLQAAALSLQPQLGEVLATGLELGAAGALVSGSGPTVAFLAASPAEAIDLSVGLAARGPHGDIIRAAGPVGGAHVVAGYVPQA